MTTPVFYNEFMRLEAGRRLLNFLGEGGGCRQGSGHGGVGTQEVFCYLTGSVEGGAVIDNEVTV